MGRATPRKARGGASVARTAATWAALPEIPFGRYLLSDIGWVTSRRERAIAAGVHELPRPRGDVDDETVVLPSVTVVEDGGQMRNFRLPLSYAAVVIGLVLREDGLRRGPQSGLAEALELPCHFVIGDREAVYFVPERSNSALLN